MISAVMVTFMRIGMKGKDGMRLQIFGPMIVLLSLLSFSMAVVAQDTPEFTPVSEDCFVTVQSGYEFDCGHVTVPEEHAQADNGRTITLAVLRVKSTSDTPGTPMFVLTGGPGGSGFSRVIDPYLGQSYGPILEHRDVVFFSQRGTTHATPFLGCSEEYTANLQILRENLTGSDRRFVLNNATEACYNRLQADDVNLNAFDSIENAADVNAIRQALGYEKVVVYGQSYGTVLAQWVMKTFPEIVESVILDGSIGLDSVTDWGAVNVRNDQFVQNRIIEDCLADAACSGAFPNIEDGFNTVMRQLADTPVTLIVPDPETQEAIPYLLTPQNLGNTINLIARAAPSLYPILAAQLEAGDTSSISNLVTALALPTPDIGTAFMMHYAVICAEDPSYSLMGMIDMPESLQHLTSYYYGMDDAEKYVFACSLIDVDPLPDGNDVVPATEMPILFLNGRFDNATITLNNEALAAQFPQHYTYEFRNGSHIQLTSENNHACAAALVEAYIENPTTAPDGTCAEETPGLMFLTPRPAAPATEATAEATASS